ncbi:MAG TPA: glycogen-binding domain-containing protein [Gemmatimonadales bacterium]|nr:glycogen-binding domain-containing protein [Gemmatimonadales bacterium]
MLLVAGLAAASARAQTQGSLGVGIGTVRTETGASFSSAALSPALRYTAPGLVVSASAFLASLPDGVWASHGRLYLWGTTRRVTGRWRLGGEGTMTGTSWTGGAWTSAAHGLGEASWSSATWGFGLGAGPSAGWIANEPSVVALHTRARAWWRPGGRAAGTAWQLTLEPTHFVGAWFTDVSADVTVERGRAVLSLSPEVRVSSVYGSTGAASVFAQVAVAPSVSVEAGGGSYLRDPYQGFPRGGFFTLGVRIGSTRAARAVAGAKRWAPLIPERRGDSLVVQFRFTGVHTVAMAGDWNGWEPRLLRAVGADVWEGRLALGRGIYHFNLLVDGHDWVVPNGVVTVPDGLGGMVAVLIVP